MKTPPSKLFFVLSLIAALLFAASANAADIQVRVDRNDIELNETFTLVFEASGAVDGDPDFSPLQQDFQILNRSTSSNISIINGQYTRSQRWSLTLMATREGTVTIPSVQFGKDSSPPYQITVKPVRQSSANSTDPFISELEVSESSVLPQQQIIVTQRLLSARNISAYEFSQLHFSGVDASVEPLGKPKQYQVTRGNTPYLVLEQRYAIFPQSSGTLTIDPSIASARVEIGSGSQSIFDPFRSNTRTIRRASSSKTITIDPLPTTFQGKHWLIAKDVQLLEDFPAHADFKAGEPITRTLSLQVDGQSASQLPEFQINEIDGLKQYPDQPETQNNISGDGIIASQQLKIAIIPAKEGQYTLPEISIPWWNSKTGKMQTAHIPARTFQVGKSTAQVSSAPPAPTPATTSGNNMQTPSASITESAEATQADNSLAWKIISLLLLLAWLSTLYLLWKQSRHKTAPVAAPAPNSISMPSIYKQLQQACNRQDPRATRDALLHWANALFTHSPVYSLGELATRTDGKLATQIQQLNQFLYKNSAENWQCNELVSLCRDFESSTQTRQKQPEQGNTLEPLYK